jgi:hypothetical protein
MKKPGSFHTENNTKEGNITKDGTQARHEDTDGRVWI